MYRLGFEDHDPARSALETEAARLLIGSAPHARLRLTEPGVSDRHAVIEQRDDGYYLCDLGSATGTRLNGQPVTEHRLLAGDLIELAAVRLRFELIQPPRRRWRPDLVQLLAGLGVAAIILGELVVLGWVVAEPRSRQMRKEVHSEVAAPVVPAPAIAPPTLLPAPPETPATPAPGPTAGPAGPAVLNRMLKIQRVDRADAVAGVTLRVLIRGQVGERALDPSAAGVSVEWFPVGGAGQTIWLQIPVAWDNFSDKALTAHWAGSVPKLGGYIVRTYYHGRLQDVLAQPPALTNAP